MSGFSYGFPADMPERELCAAFTGHRPQNLPWGYDELDPRCVLLKSRIEEEIRAAYAQGKRFFLSGMAEGVDTYAAEAALKLKKELPELALICVFPCGIARDKRRGAISRGADTVVSLYEKYCTGCMIARDRFLVSRSSLLIAACSSGANGGTAATMRMASEAGIKIRVIPIAN